MFYTGTERKIDFDQIPKALVDFYEKTKIFDTSHHIIIGTDSQNHYTTKVVTVICMICEGHGGIFFYEITNIPVVKEVRRKLRIETQESLETAEKLVELLESDEEYEELYLDCPISIHVDAGNSPKGKTKELIPEITGWVKACGYNVSVKPDSFAASSIADKISK